MLAGTQRRPEAWLRAGRREDAADLARLVDLASEGLTSYLWARIAEPGEDAFAVGVRRAGRDEGAFSWRNAVIAEVDGQAAGGLVTYRIGTEPEPVDELPAMFRPLQALENRALGTQYVNVLATHPAFRRCGVGTRLLAEAERRAAGRGLSLIVADRNRAARRLYRAFGFREAAEEAIVKEDWICASDAWVLMLKPPPR